MKCIPIEKSLKFHLKNRFSIENEMNKIFILFVVSMVITMVIDQSLGHKCKKEGNKKCVKEGDCCEGLKCWRDDETSKYGVCKKTDGE